MIGMLHSNLEKFLELYHLIETNSLDEQIGDIREWNTTYSNINLTNCQFLLGRLKIVRQIPEQAECKCFHLCSPMTLSHQLIEIKLSVSGKSLRISFLGQKTC